MATKKTTGNNIDLSEDEILYDYLKKTDSEGEEYLNAEEQKEFEEFLGI